MLYLRISLMVPRPGQAGEATRLLQEVTNFCAGQSGYIGAYVLERHEAAEMIGRVTFWEDAASADAVAQSSHMLALRATLNRLVVEGSHQEYGFIATRAPLSQAESELHPGDALDVVTEILREARGSDAPPPPRGDA